MKTVNAFSLDTEVSGTLRKTAEALDVPMSEIVEVALQNALALGETELERLLSSRRQENDSAAAKLSKRERILLDAYEQILERYADPDHKHRGHRFFSLREIANQAGLYPGDALQGLRGLQRRKILKCVTNRLAIQATDPDAQEVEHWGRLG